MGRLINLCEVVPPEAVPAVLRMATYAVRRDMAIEGGHRDPDLPAATQDQAVRLVQLLMRRIDEAARPYDLDYESATAAVALAVLVPDELAGALAVRLRVTLNGRWPLGWDEHWRALAPENRAPFARALRQRLDVMQQLETADTVTSQQLESAVATVAAGTAEWANDVQRWAAGDRTERRRAAASVTHCWRDPVWPGVVAHLLNRGIDATDREQLLRGVEITMLDPDIATRAQPRLAALDRLAEVGTGESVAAFVHEARRRVEAAVNDYAADARARARGYAAR